MPAHSDRLRRIIDERLAERDADHLSLIVWRGRKAGASWIDVVFDIYDASGERVSIESLRRDWFPEYACGSDEILDEAPVAPSAQSASSQV